MLGDFLAKEEKTIFRTNRGKWIFQENDILGDFLGEEERMISRVKRGKWISRMDTTPTNDT